MRKDKIIKYSGIAFLVLFIVVQIFNHNKNYNEINEEASDKWGKSIQLSETYLKSSPAIINNKDNVYVAYSTEKGVRFTILDRNGNLVGEKDYDLGLYMDKMTFVQKDNEIIFYWISYKKGVKSLNAIRLKDNLDYQEISKVDGIDTFYKISEDELLVDKKGYLYVMNRNLEEISKFYTNHSEKLDAIKYEDKIYIAYFKNGRCYLTIIEDGKVSKSKELLKLPMTGKSWIGSVSMNVNESEVLIGYGLYINKTLQYASIIRYNLDSKITMNTKLQNLNPAKRGNPGEGFVSNVPYVRNGRFKKYDVIEFNMKNGKMIEKQFISNTRLKSGYPVVYGDYAVFGDYTSVNKYDMRLNIVSGKYDVKNVQIDKTYAIMTTVQGIIFTILHLVTRGLVWLLPMILLSGITSFVLISSDESKNKVLYTINFLIVGAIQIVSLYNALYKDDSRVVDNLMSMPLGMAIIIGLLTITGMIGYKIYEEDMDVVMTLVLGGTVITESLLVFAIFGQYL